MLSDLLDSSYLLEQGGMKIFPLFSDNSCHCCSWKKVRHCRHPHTGPVAKALANCAAVHSLAAE